MENKNSHPGSFLFILAQFILITICAIRKPGLDLDSLNYFSELNLTFEKIDFLSKEPAYWLIQQLNLEIFDGSSISFFLVFALIAIPLKFLFISKFSYNVPIGLFTYISFFYIIQDMTQIRSGVAIALVALSVKEIIIKNRKNFLILICLATLFHYSAIVFLGLYFINPKKKTLIFYCLLPVLALFLTQLNIAFKFFLMLTDILPGFLANKILVYLNLWADGDIKTVNPFNPGNFFLLTIAYVSTWIVNKSQCDELKSKVVVLSLKYIYLGFFILFGFSFIEVFSYRIANYLFFFYVIIIPYLCVSLRPKSIPLVIFITFLAYTLFKNMNIMLNLEVLK